MLWHCIRERIASTDTNWNRDISDSDIVGTILYRLRTTKWLIKLAEFRLCCLHRQKFEVHLSFFKITICRNIIIETIQFY